MIKFWQDHPFSKPTASKKAPTDTAVEITFAQYCAINHPNLYVYDIETYPNVFTVSIVRPADGAVWRFEISPRVNQGIGFYVFLSSLRDTGGRLVGFNNVGFDYPVIHELITRGGHITAGELFAKCDSIINGDFNNRFQNMVWESDVFVQQVDLYKIHHFDNSSRSTSLKMIEFNMQSANIQDLPYRAGYDLTLDQIDPLIKYNDHDVYETLKFLAESIPMIEYRDTVTEKYNRNFTNHNDTKIGKDYFIMELERYGVQCYEKRDGKKQPVQTARPFIDLGDVVLPWLSFETPQFQRLLEWIRNYRIHGTKNVFGDLDMPPSMVPDMNPELIKVHGLTSADMPNVKPKQLAKGVKLSKLSDTFLLRPDLDRFKFISGDSKKSGLNTTVNGLSYVFGTGGIHASVESQTVVSDDQYILIDLDVASYYPNLAIANDFYPEHLGRQFCDIYVDVYNQRKTFAKGTAENAMLKLALNGVYGDSNSQYSPFYDPAYTMSITVNGQLLLCLLAEQLMKINTLSVIQVNTDGLTVKVDRRASTAVMDTAARWEKQTGLELERVDYNRMFIRDVNNYIGEYVNGGVKRKGTYCHGDDLAWHQNFNSQIIAIAAEKELIENIPVEQTIYGCTDVMLFMCNTKVPRSSRLELEIDGGREPLQNITRYVVTNSGGALVKVMPPLPAKVKEFAPMPAPDRRMSVCKGWNVTPCNDLTNHSKVFDICYEYYIQEATKIVRPLQC